MKTILIGIMCLMLVSCATWQSTITKIAQDDAKNAAVTRIAAKQIISTWSLNSSALAVVLEKFKNLLPCDCQGDIQKLDAIAAKCVIKDANGILTCEELTDKDMGQVVILWGWVWGSITKSGIDKLMQTFFPSVLAKILPYVTVLGL